MRWYNPTTRVVESVLALYTDEEAEHMLRGATDSWALLREYERHRGGGMGIEQAMVFLGDSFNLWHPRHQSLG